MHTPFRGKSYVYAYIGLVNKDAQRSAHITSSFSGDESQIYNGGASSGHGIVSTENDGSVTFTFEGNENNIAGLTITFETQPSSITVTNGEKTEEYSISGTDFSVDDGYTNCHYIKITPNSGKLALKSILFGVGIQFTNRQIISTNRENTVNHISNELPKKSFSITVDNSAHMFNKDNPYGYADYLQEQQEVTFDYGREMSDGSIYKIKGGKVFLKDWSSDDYQAKFTCLGRLSFLEGKYIKGKFYENGISAYALAELVFQDAGITAYKLDESMKRIVIYNPIPIVEYREALKMIANASRCTLYEDRDGDICIGNANMPSFIYTCKFTGAMNYCIPSAIFDDNSMYNYADAEYEYTHADGTLLFLPDNDDYRQVGFVSSEIANSNGLFSNNPKIEISFKSEFDLHRLLLNFAVVVPTSVTVTCMLEGEVVNTQTFTTNLSLRTEYLYDGIIDAITITFNSANPNQRIHLNNIAMDGAIQYYLTYRELKNSPTVSSLEKVSKLKVHSYAYNVEKTEEGSSHSSYVKVDYEDNEYGGQTANITTGTSEYGSAISTIHAQIGQNQVTFTSPYYNYKVTAGTILESGAYYMILESDEEQDIDIYAQPYTVTDNIYTMDIHEKGVEKNSENPLISSVLGAKQQAEWLRDYYDDDLEYSLTYRGDPVLDADDLIYLENRFVANNEIRIVNETINTSTGMDFTCRLNARRTSFQTDATIAKAIVGRVKMGERL